MYEYKEEVNTCDGCEANCGDEYHMTYAGLYCEHCWFRFTGE